MMNSSRIVMTLSLFLSLTVYGEITVSVSGTVKPGGAVLSGHAKTIPHSGFSAAVATEKAAYQPIEMNINPVTTRANGLIRLDYYPYFSSPGKRLIVKSGEVALYAMPDGVELCIGNETFTGKYQLQQRVWYTLELCWHDGKVMLSVDGHTVIAMNRATLPVGGNVFFGGMPDGLLRGLTADNPTQASPVMQIGEGVKLDFTVRANNPEYFTFDYFDHGQAQKLRIRPILKIIPGDRFAVEQSGGEPLYVTAVDAGELVLNLPGTWSNRVEIRRDPGNLLADASFEEPSGNWKTIMGTRLSPQRNFSFTPQLQESPLPPVSPLSDTVCAVTGTACNGKQSLEINKRNAYSIVTVKSLPVNLKPNTRYMLGVWHKVAERPLWGGSFYVQVILLEGKKVKQTFSQSISSSPLRLDGNWRYIPLGFATPSGKSPLTAQVALIADGAPCKIYVDDLSLRESPGLVFNPMPPDQDKSRLLTGSALIEHMKKRSPVKLPAAPMTGVAGYDLNCYKAMNNSGVDLLWSQVSSNWRAESPEWCADGTYDFSLLDERILNVLSYAPDAVVGLYLGIDPAMDFGERYPDAIWRGRNGNPIRISQPDSLFYPERAGKTFPYVSYTAPDFRREAGKYLRAFGEHLKRVPWGKAVGAIHLYGGGDGQWFYRPIKNDSDDLIDRSSGNLLAMREKLRSYYHNDLAAFRRAWGDDKLTFETVEFPPESLWRKYPFFRDPNDPEARKLIDLSLLYPEAINDVLGALNTEFEGGLGRRVLKSRYYYGTALGQLLNSPEFDGFVSVPPYGESRLHGMSGRLHQAAAPATLRNKFFLSELDLRTSYSSFPVRNAYSDRNWLGVEKGPENFGHTLRKMAAPALISGQGWWYLMIGGNSSYQQEFARYIKEAAEAAHLSRRPAVNVDGATAVFWDEKARTVMGPIFGYGVDAQSNHKPQEQWYRSGLAVQTYLLEDLENTKRRPAKLNLFPLASTMTEKQIRYVEKNLQKNGNVLVFAFDAGRTAPGGFEQNIKRLTGMTVRHRPDIQVLSRFGQERFSDPLSSLIGMPLYPAASSFMIPLFYVDDPAARPLALLDGSRLVGAAVKRHKDWTAVYFSVPVGFALSPELLRALAAEAGVKPVGPAGDVTYAGNGFVVIHATSSGIKRLDWDTPADVLDISSGNVIARNAVKLELEMKFGETRWFRLLKP